MPQRVISVAQVAIGGAEVVPKGASAVLITLTITETEGNGGYVSV